MQKNGALTKESYTISAEGGLTHREDFGPRSIYLADVNFYGFEIRSAYIRSHNGLGR